MRILVLACLATAGCSGADSANVDTNNILDMGNFAGTDYGNAAMPTPAAAQPPPAPEPRYSERDGDTYFYVAAVSEEQRQKGQAAGDVVGFRYLGNSGGIYRLQNTSSGGAVNECTNPCRIIKVRYSSGSLDHMAFSTSSIIGSAFIDAFNGFLQPVSAARTPPRPAAPAFVEWQSDPVANSAATDAAPNNSTASTPTDNNVF